jgi:hypothetical protein
MSFTRVASRLHSDGTRLARVRTQVPWVNSFSLNIKYTISFGQLYNRAHTRSRRANVAVESDSNVGTTKRRIVAQFHRVCPD